MRSISKIVKLLSRFFNKEKIKYVFTGAIAVGVWGEPRATRDIDIIVELKEKQLKKFVNFLIKENFEVDEKSAAAALKEGTHFTVFDKRSSYLIDVAPAFKIEHLLTLKKRKKVKFDRTSIYVSSPEGTIVAKLFFGSAQDISDAKSIFLRHYDKLNFDELEKEAKIFGVEKKYLKLKKWIERRI